MSNRTFSLAAFFAEIRRRRVYHVAAVYIAVAFGAAQAGDLLVSAFALPVWLFTATVVLCITGLPVAVILAWVFEVSPAGVKKTEPHNPESHAHRHRLPIICFAALALICFGAAAHALISGVQRQSIRDRSLAVLPFVNLADNSGHDYFSMGLTEDVLTSVAGARRLRVVGRNSSKVYRQTQKSLREIADELDVTYLLQGSVRREQDRVRISVQLVNAETDEYLWAESYDRKLQEVFRIQADIAEQIARELGTRLAPDERRHLASRRIPDPQVYDLVLRSREYSSRLRREEHQMAIQMARSAVERDAQYADAHARLAYAYAVDVQRYGADRAWLDSALVAARQAIALDSSLAGGHAALGVAMLAAGRTREAEAALRKAVPLDPSDGAPLINLGIIGAMQGELDQAVYWLRRALVVEPRRADLINYNLAVAYGELGLDSLASSALAAARALRPDLGFARFMSIKLALGKGDIASALAEADSMVADEPKNANAWVIAGEAYLHADNLDAARKALEKAYSLGPTSAGMMHTAVRYAQVLRAAGHRRRSDAVLEQFDSLAAAELAAGNASRDLALSQAGAATLRQDTIVALKHLSDVVRRGWVDAPALRIDPLFETLSRSPHFTALLERIEVRAREQRVRIADLQ